MKSKIVLKRSTIAFVLVGLLTTAVASVPLARAIDIEREGMDALTKIGKQQLGKIDGIDDILNSLGPLRTILDLLGLKKWEKALNKLLGNPCSDAPVIFITAPEPGWCVGRGGLSDVLDEAAGDMGIPNPNDARQSAEEEAKDGDSTPDVFEINKDAYAVGVGNLIDRIATRQAIESVLGKPGQEKTVKELDSNSQAVEDNALAASQAQELDVTQDIMKLFITNDARTSAISAASRAELSRLRTDVQFTNLNLVNISRTLDEQARHYRVQRAASSAKILTLSAQAGLIGAP